MEMCKAHLVTNGFKHKEGISYKETLSLIFMKDYFRIIITLIVHFNLKLHHMDVKIMFLNIDIDETIYMMQPKYFVSRDPKNMICKLKKSIYGIKQASR